MIMARCATRRLKGASSRATPSPPSTASHPAAGRRRGGGAAARRHLDAGQADDGPARPEGAAGGHAAAGGHPQVLHRARHRQQDVGSSGEPFRRHHATDLRNQIEKLGA